MYKGLVIGCGSIGAGYDWHCDQILTHAKAMACNPNIDLTVADSDLEAAKVVAERYEASYLTDIDEESLSKFDIVSLCVSTKYHIDYLRLFSKLDIPFIICEKPIVANLSELEELNNLNLNHDKILINYARRFLPGFELLKRRLSSFLSKEGNELRHIVIKYHRGFLNNGSHALDLICFLLESRIILNDIRIGNVEFDVFPNDPTISLFAKVNNCLIDFIGFTQSKFKIFEIDLFTSNEIIKLSESGNIIKYYSVNESGKMVEQIELMQTDVLHNYMVPVLSNAINCLRENRPSNFTSAIEVNTQMLEILSRLK